MQVQCTTISAAFGDRDVLKEVSVLLSAGIGHNAGGGGTRAALAGVNGSGKSTLMQIIAGIRAPDSGNIAVSKGCRISYLPQSGLAFGGRTLREEAETAYGALAALLREAEELGRKLESAGETGKDSKASAALVEEHHRLLQAVEDSGYYRREETVEQVLAGLGFSRADLSKECTAFSGGWQMRIALAKVLLENPDIMLLDEPTNYLDIEARSWLLAYLKRFRGGFLLVSHDRYFLDACINEVYEIFQGALKRYAGNYSAYEKIRREELESLAKRYREQQEEIAKSEALIERFRYKATKAAMVQERIKKLEKIERIEIPESLKKIAVNFPPAPRSGRVALSLRGVGKRYGSKQVLAGLDLDVDAGERLLVAGRNGTGKTTLLRIIAGVDKNYEGTAEYGTGIAPGYFSQDAGGILDTIGLPDTGIMDTSGIHDNSGAHADNGTVLSVMEAAAPTALFPKIRDMLGAFLFRGDDVYKKCSVLSGGEKSRLALLRLLLKPLNLLVLDEPTNHLDLHSKDVLLDALLQFSGTIIFVSHDRSFMEALSTKTLELRLPDPGFAANRADTTFTGASAPTGASVSAARLFYGGYGYYLERESLLSTTATPVPAADSRTGTDGVALPTALAAAQRAEAKQRQTLLRRLERQEADILAALEELEKTKAHLEEELAKPGVYSNGEKAKAVKTELDKVTEEMEAKTAEWEVCLKSTTDARHS